MNGKTTIVTASDDGLLEEWDPQSGSLLRKVTHNGSISRHNTVTFSDDGKYLAVGFPTRVWDLERFELVRILENHEAWFIWFGSSSTVLLSNSQNDGRRSVWDIESSANKSRLSQNGKLTSLCFAPNCNLLIPGTLSNRLRLISPNRRH